jgi:hypothetical protein
MSSAPGPEPRRPVGSLRELALRYAGVCARCGRSLPVGTQAVYNFSTRTVQCTVCPATDDPGIPGASAQAEADRRKAKREINAKRTLGNILGGVLLATKGEPQTTLAWEIGAYGERKLAEILAGVPNAKLLHDRRIPGTRANLDHLLVAPAGVFVVDCKLHRGRIHLRNKGGFFSNDLRLYVGSRDRSAMAEKTIWQVEVVQQALEEAGFKPAPLIVPVICFVDGSWQINFPPPQQFEGVWLEDGRSITRFVAGRPVLDADTIARVHHALAMRFPAR